MKNTVYESIAHVWAQIIMYSNSVSHIIHIYNESTCGWHADIRNKRKDCDFVYKRKFHMNCAFVISYTQPPLHITNLKLFRIFTIATQEFNFVCLSVVYFLSWRRWGQWLFTVSFSLTLYTLQILLSNSDNFA